MAVRSGIRLSVVLVNYHTTALAAACLRSMRQHLALDRVEVILVDNATAGFDPASLYDAWPGLRIIESPENLGFGRGSNLGAREASGEYLWLLNTDTLVPAGHRLDAVLDFLDEHREYAAALPLLTDGAGEVQPWQAGYFPALWRMVLSVPVHAIARVAPFAARRFAGIDTAFRPLRDGDVDHVVAAAVVVRRTAFEAVGGFSPAYFFFLEDTDLCRRLRAEGWRIRWMPQAHIVHLWGRSVPDPVARQRLFFAAQDLYFRRWHSRAGLWGLRLIRIPRWISVRWRARRGLIASRAGPAHDAGAGPGDAISTSGDVN